MARRLPEGQWLAAPAIAYPQFEVKRMPDPDRPLPPLGYTIGRTLGKRWRWVLGGAICLGVALYLHNEYASLQARRADAEQGVRANALAVAAERARVSAVAASVALEAAKTPAQRAAEKLTADQARRAVSDKQEAQARMAEKIDAIPWWNRCRAWGHEVTSNTRSPWRDALFEHLVSGNFLNAQDLAHVTDRTPAIGMTTCGIYAQLGIPSVANTTTTAFSTTVQMVYRDRGVNVYTRASPNDGNGIVEGVQN